MAAQGPLEPSVDWPCGVAYDRRPLQGRQEGPEHNGATNRQQQEGADSKDPLNWLAEGYHDKSASRRPGSLPAHGHGGSGSLGPWPTTGNNEAADKVFRGMQVSCIQRVKTSRMGAGVQGCRIGRRDSYLARKVHFCVGFWMSVKMRRDVTSGYGGSRWFKHLSRRTQETSVERLAGVVSRIPPRTQPERTLGLPVRGSGSCLDAFYVAAAAAF